MMGCGVLSRAGRHRSQFQAIRCLKDLGHKKAPGALRGLQNATVTNYEVRASPRGLATAQRSFWLMQAAVLELSRGGPL